MMFATYSKLILSISQGFFELPTDMWGGFLAGWPPRAALLVIIMHDIDISISITVDYYYYYY